MPNADGALVVACPERIRYVLETVVLADDSSPASGLEARLRRGGGQVLRTLTDSSGLARFEGLEPGELALSLPTLDSAVWQVLRFSELPGSGAFPAKAALWEAEPVDTNRALFTHQVTEGETTTNLAARFGLHSDQIWNYPSNASLRAKRADPDILAPRDLIFIPPCTPKWEPVNTGFRYFLRRIGVPTVLRIRFLNAFEKPRAGVAYLLSAETSSGTPFKSREGTTDGDGVLSEPVPLDIARAVVCLGRPPFDDRIEIQIGYLDPLQTSDGVRHRLANLGYLRDSAAGETSEEDEMKQAIARFQLDHGLDATGVMDDAARAELAKLHLC